MTVVVTSTEPISGDEKSQKIGFGDNIFHYYLYLSNCLIHRLINGNYLLSYSNINPSFKCFSITSYI